MKRWLWMLLLMTMAGWGLPRPKYRKRESVTAMEEMLSGWLNLTQTRISPKQMASLGWVRVDLIMGHFPQFAHPSGWRIGHCCHPTANWPYWLRDPQGNMICQGAHWHGDPQLGPAWQTAAQAMAYVETVLRASKSPRGQPEA